MKPILKKYGLETPKTGMVDITATVRKALADVIALNNLDGKEVNGNVIIFCPHTTGAITINENADPDVQSDFMFGLANAYPENPLFKHAEGNSAAHLKSSVVGCNETIIVCQGQLVLGTWQGVYFCEFDGPRSRSFYVQVNLA